MAASTPISQLSAGSAERAAHGRAARWPAPLSRLVALLRARPEAGPDLDAAGWDRFADLVTRRHRIAPAVLGGLRATGLRPPAAVLGRIEDEVAANGFAALAQKAETARLLPELSARGCVPVLLKGWPLAEELTGSAAGRHFQDIDLYIEPCALGTCLEVLEGLGYRTLPEHRRLRPLAGRAAMMAECNDLALWNEARGTLVELHWRSNHFRGWADLRDAGQGWRDWPLDRTGTVVRVPQPGANLAYLSLHGQQHGWTRLKWLHDIALIRRRRDAAALADDLEVARRVGAGRAVVAALHMVERVFGDPVPEGWPQPDFAVGRMIGWMLEGIAADRIAPGWLRAHLDFYLTGLVLGEGLGQRLGVLRYALWRRPRLGFDRLVAGAAGG